VSDCSGEIVHECPSDGTCGAQTQCNRCTARGCTWCRGSEQCVSPTDARCQGQPIVPAGVSCSTSPTPMPRQISDTECANYETCDACVNNPLHECVFCKPTGACLSLAESQVCPQHVRQCTDSTTNASGPATDPERSPSTDVSKQEGNTAGAEGASKNNAATSANEGSSVASSLPKVIDTSVKPDDSIDLSGGAVASPDPSNNTLFYILGAVGVCILLIICIVLIIVCAAKRSRSSSSSSTQSSFIVSSPDSFHDTPTADTFGGNNEYDVSPFAQNPPPASLHSANSDYAAMPFPSNNNEYVVGDFTI